ncbi:hypothetical protein BKA93DRAFT_748867 [Sparassis latifolia]
MELLGSIQDIFVEAHGQIRLQPCRRLELAASGARSTEAMAESVAENIFGLGDSDTWEGSKYAQGEFGHDTLMIVHKANGHGDEQSRRGRTATGQSSKAEIQRKMGRNMMLISKRRTAAVAGKFSTTYTAPHLHVRSCFAILNDAIPHTRQPV